MTTSPTHPLSCSCGAVRGTWNAREGAPGICHCDDCQAAARWLQVPGILDENGGTEVVQTWPSLVTWREGVEHLALFRLSENGLLRFYAACCRAPLMNAMPRRGLPFVGLFMARLDDDGRAEVHARLGPSIGVQGRFAPRGTPNGVHPTASVGVIARAASLLVRGFFRGAARPSPVFDVDDAFRVTPRVLSVEERAALSG